VSILASGKLFTMIETLAISLCFPILISAAYWLLLNSYHAVAYTVSSLITGDSNGDGKLDQEEVLKVTTTLCNDAGEMMKANIDKLGDDDGKLEASDGLSAVVKLGVVIVALVFIRNYMLATKIRAHLKNSRELERANQVWVLCL